MNHQSHNGCRYQTFHPHFAFHKQVDRHQRRNDSAADIDRNYCTVPIAHDRHGVAHAEEIDDLIGRDVLWRQLRDRDVEKAADQRLWHRSLLAGAPMGAGRSGSPQRVRALN
jgi:hypothetical protein